MREISVTGTHLRQEKRQGYEADFGPGRFHHEIYLSDVRRCKPERLKTVIRHPIKKADI